MTVTDVQPSSRRLQWMTATVSEVIEETPRVRSLVLEVPAWPGHRAGQHVDVRLTGEDGYQAQRSYSIASAPEAPHVMLTVERLADGEVSSYLACEVHAGDAFEMRGPIGGYFVWTTVLDGPLFLVAGGSGVVPMMAMLRHRAAANDKTPATLLIPRVASTTSSTAVNSTGWPGRASRSCIRSTRTQPPSWSGFARRIDRAMLEATDFPVERAPAHLRLRADAASRGGGAQLARHRPRAGTDQD